ncbi:MAG: leucine-rich repeat protein [Bacilli bacterium]|nr:leucine-rich repeat protein [Bacilli bacterium]
MELFNLTDLEKHSTIEQVKIKKDIIQTHDLSLIPPAYLPKVHTKNYYFVSYSHLDYKEVYCDIFDLQQEGISIWYDRGIYAGENWKDTASKYIVPFDCKGVLFYISENALLSKAVMEEIKFVCSKNKPYIVILISKEDISLKSLILKLFEEGRIDKKTKNFFMKAFPEEIIYVKYLENIKKKRDLIANSIPPQPVLDLDSAEINGFFNGEDLEISGYSLIVRGLNDYYIKNLTPKDFVNFMDSQTAKKKIGQSMSEYTKETKKKVNSFVSKYSLHMNLENIETLNVCPAAFSNMKNLTSVKLPLGYGGENSIGSHAFYRCDNLEKVSFDGPTGKIKIGDFAFAGCKSLSRFDFSRITLDGVSIFQDCVKLRSVSLSRNPNNNGIPASTFNGCKSLKEIAFNDHIYSIGHDSFSGTGIRSLTLPRHLLSIEPYAFSSCSKLETIIFNDELSSIGMNSFNGCKSLKELHFPSSLQRIDSDAFAECTALSEIHLPSSVHEIEDGAFILCDSLSSVYYEGSSDDFLKATKDNPDKCFAFSKNDISIICQDKTIVIKKHL